MDQLIGQLQAMLGRVLLLHENSRLCHPSKMIDGRGASNELSLPMSSIVLHVYTMNVKRFRSLVDHRDCLPTLSASQFLFCSSFLHSLHRRGKALLAREIVNKMACFGFMFVRS